MIQENQKHPQGEEICNKQKGNSHNRWGEFDFMIDTMPHN
jgi:hypothetical protein